MPSIISQSQATSVHGRQILDGVLIANECIHSRHKEKMTGVLCKLDMEKAYDKVEWGFLSYLMSRMGFGAKWHSWIMECVSTTRFSISINGTPKGFFQASKGLCQGDPLSPFLFDIVAEALSRMISAAGEANLIFGFRLAANGATITHLQFSDNTIIFCDAKEDQIKNIVAILRCFEAISRLKVIFLKSELISISADDHLLEDFANIMGCKVASILTSYMALPLCLGSAPQSLWNPVLERMEQKLASWKAKNLSFEGRITLIQTALANLPLYFLSIFNCPALVIKRIEKLQQEFLWQGKSNKEISPSKVEFCLQAKKRGRSGL